MIVDSTGTEITLKDNANYEVLVKLSGVSVNVKIHWNESSKIWVMSMYNAKGDAIFEGQTMIFYTNLLYPWRGFGAPAGAIVLFDNTKKDEAPTREGVEHYRLMFFPEVA